MWAKTLRDQGTCSRSHSQLVTDLGTRSRVLSRALPRSEKCSHLPCCWPSSPQVTVLWTNHSGHKVKLVVAWLPCFQRKNTTERDWVWLGYFGMTPTHSWLVCQSPGKHSETIELSRFLFIPGNLSKSRELIPWVPESGPSSSPNSPNGPGHMTLHFFTHIVEQTDSLFSH